MLVSFLSIKKDFVAMVGCGAEAVKLEAEAGTEGFLKGLA